MIKRPESSASSSLRPLLPCSNPETETEDHNGKDKYQRHGNLLERVQRWMARNGKVMVIGATALILSVFLIPPFKVMLKHTSPIPTVTAAAVAAQQQNQSFGNANNAQQQQEEEQVVVKKINDPITIPSCLNTPWKEDENLQGKCPGDLKPYKEATTIETCASSCCDSADCISWQFRGDVGCLQGKDIRLGMEKDGPSAWCSDHPPQKWSGQYLRPHGLTEGFNAEDLRKDACSTESWNPNQEIGQCFGLGDVKKHGSGSAEECMEACCNEEKFICGAWQWNEELGCFYGKGMHGCQGEGDPVAFEPFVGRRKHLDSRRYTDNHNKPWQMAMS